VVFHTLAPTIPFAVMTMETKNPPTKIARQDSHHVRPRVTKEETVAHVPGLIRSDTQSGQTFHQHKYLPNSVYSRCGDSQVKNVQVVHRRYSGGLGSISTLISTNTVKTGIRLPLLLHTSSGAIQLSSLGNFQAETLVERALIVSTTPMVFTPGQYGRISRFRGN